MSDHLTDAEIAEMEKRINGEGFVLVPDYSGSQGSYRQRQEACPHPKELRKFSKYRALGYCGVCDVSFDLPSLDARLEQLGKDASRLIAALREARMDEAHEQALCTEAQENYETQRARADMWEDEFCIKKAERDAALTRERALNIAIANVTKAVQTEEWAALGTVNESIQQLVDAFMVSRRAALQRAEKAEARPCVEICQQERAKGSGGCGACALCCKEATERATAAEEALTQHTHTIFDLAGKLKAAEEERDRLEQEYRKRLWIGHGHLGLYGDDGEMQCNQCSPWDFKRAPIAELERAVQRAALARLDSGERPPSEK